jgi:hypothetical protein
MSTTTITVAQLADAYALAARYRTERDEARRRADRLRTERDVLHAAHSRLHTQLREAVRPQ